MPVINLDRDVWQGTFVRGTEAHEVGGGHWLDFAAQAAQRLAVDARQNATVAKFHLMTSARAREVAAQDLAFGFELRERDLDITQG